MKIEIDKIEIENSPCSLTWRNNELVDWVNGGDVYKLNGKFVQSGISIGYKFDGVKVSDNGQYVVIYERLGTKALILKDSKIIREINRSYYCAEVYEYPIEILKLPNNEYAIIHCPEEYNKIEIEHIESGNKITSNSLRKPDDYFHSRFEINNSRSHLISSGWYWHPWGSLEIYNLSDSLKDSSTLDKTTKGLPINGEVGSARFISDNKIVIGMTTEEPLDDELKETSNTLFPEQIGIMNINNLTLEKKIKIDGEPGDLIPINDNYVWSLYEFPKIFDLNTGQIVCECKNINSGTRNSSIIWHKDYLPIYSYDSKNERLAIVEKNKIKILTLKR